MENNEDPGPIQYSFGIKYNYTQRFMPNEVSVTKKYNNFKTELISNNICNIDSTEWMFKLQKARYYANASNTIRRKMNVSAMTIQHLLAMILYTDTNDLQNKLTSTYRAIKVNESKQSIMKRHREFYHWGKLLDEAVNVHGTRLERSEYKIFYHGVSFLYFDAFIAEFCSPTSTTTSLEIAAGFAKSDGIILELKRHQYGQGNPMYFNCELISKFDWEKEKLFIGGRRGWQSGPLQFNSIRLMEIDKNLEHFVHFLTIFNQIVIDYSDKYQIRANDTHFESISNLIHCTIGSNVYEYPDYIIQCFRQFCDNQTGRLLLDLNHECWENVLHLGYNNLLRFDVVSNKLFPNCTAFDCYGVRYVSSEYLDSLLLVLEMMRDGNDDRNKVKQIKLFDVSCEMTKYNDDFREKRIKFGKKGFYMDLKYEDVITVDIEYKENPDFDLPVTKEPDPVIHGEVMDTAPVGEQMKRYRGINRKQKYGKMRKHRVGKGDKMDVRPNRVRNRVFQLFFG